LFAEDDNGAAGPQLLSAVLENGLQVVAGVRPAHGDRTARPHDVFEDRIVDEALFDDKGSFLKRGNDRRQDKGFERAHVIADEHTGAIEGLEIIHARYFKLNADALQGLERFKAAVAPVRGVVAAALRLSASPYDE